MGVKLQSALGGSVELNAPSTASNFSMTVPAGNGTVATTDQLSAFRNRIINGDMRINQRYAGNSASLSSTQTGYFMDRFLNYTNGSSLTIQRIASGLADLPWALQLTVPAGNTQVNLEQRIEADNVSDLASTTCTVSARIYVDSATSISAKVYWYYPGAKDNWASPTFVQIDTISTAQLSTGNYISYTKTFTTDANVNKGMGIVFQFDNAAGRTIRVTGIQLEKGSVATTFERRSLQTELAMCQRYYEKSYDLDTIAGSTGDWATTPVISFPKSNNILDYRSTFKVEKRATPSMTYYNPTTGSTSTGRCEQPGIQNLDYTYTVTSSFVSTSGYFVRHNMTSSTGLAELYSCGLIHYVAISEL